MAPFYAAACFGISYLVRFSQPGRGGGIGASLHPSHLAALLWPLGLALAVGVAGGFGSAFRARRARARRRATGEAEVVAEPATGWWWLRGAVAGGWRMLVVGLAMAFAGLLVLAILKPDATKAYLSPFDDSVAQGSVVVALTLLVLPNLEAWVLFPAMGGCTGIWGRVSSCLLSYWQFPGTPVSGFSARRPFAVDFPSAPPAYYLFLLVPLIAVLLGGHRAARAGRARSRGEGLALGALSGVAFAGLAAALAVLASVAFHFIRGDSPASLGSLGNGFGLGPNPYLGALVALGWGVVGGAIGGLLASPAAVPAPPPGPFVEPVTAPQPPPETPTGGPAPYPPGPLPPPPTVPQPPTVPEPAPEAWTGPSPPPAAPPPGTGPEPTEPQREGPPGPGSG